MESASVDKQACRDTRQTQEVADRDRQTDMENGSRQQMAHSGSGRVTSDTRVMNHHHPLMNKGSTLVEILPVCNLLFQTSTEYPQYLTNLYKVWAEAHIKVLKLCVCVCVCVCVRARACVRVRACVSA